ncbi:MAG: lactate utilization protein [Lachnospiraceae bacterium]
MDFAKVKENLEGLGYKVTCFEHASEATDYLNQQVDKTTVAFGGSMTLQEMGLFDRLSTHNKEVLWHWRVPEGSNGAEVLKKARDTEVYFSSVNGIAETGEIINIDGNCNRVAEMMFGHKKVYLVAGENKIAPDYEKALDRARNIAAPLNAKRLNRKTPCAVKGDHCYNCKSPERICRGLSVLWEKPSGCDYEVILIHEKLGY